MPHFRVAAGILRDRRGRVLISERRGGGPFDGMWEFPGGKVGAGENAADALARELTEEIGVRIESAEHFMHLDHDYPDRSVSIDFFLVEAWRNEPAALEAQELRWVDIGSLHAHNLLPADIPVIDALQRLADSRSRSVP